MMPFILKEGEEYPFAQSKEYHNLIKSLMNQQVTITQDTIKEAKLSQLAKTDYLSMLEPKLDKVIYNKASAIEGYTKKFYDLGKRNGFKILDVKAFTGNADVHALYNLSNYNFGLIKNLSNDLREGIRYAIWNGISKDKGIPQIAAAIEKIPVEPLRIGNRLLDIPTRALMIAKTESVRSVNQGLLLSFEKYSITKLISSLSGGHDKEDECDDYAAEGPYDIDKIPDGGPPYHPNCECTLLPAEDPANQPVDPSSYFDLVDGTRVDVPEELLSII